MQADTGPGKSGKSGRFWKIFQPRNLLRAGQENKDVEINFLSTHSLCAARSLFFLRSSLSTLLCVCALAVQTKQRRACLALIARYTSCVVYRERRARANRSHALTPTVDSIPCLCCTPFSLLPCFASSSSSYLFIGRSCSILSAFLLYTFNNSTATSLLRTFPLTRGFVCFRNEPTAHHQTPPQSEDDEADEAVRIVPRKCLMCLQPYDELGSVATESPDELKRIVDNIYKIAKIQVSMVTSKQPMVTRNFVRLFLTSTLVWVFDKYLSLGSSTISWKSLNC